MIPIITPEAQAEIETALLASQNPSRLGAAIDAALAIIGANPQIAARVGRSRVRQYPLTGRIPYSIVYTETATEIRVFAFPHSSRKPGYWKNRLPKP